MVVAVRFFIVTIEPFFKVVWIGIVGKMLILPKKIDKWDSPVMFEGLGGK